MNHPLLVILGPTAIGKTALAIHMAGAFNGEIISADSRQVYKGMDIGTGKEISAYEVDGKKIPVHLVDIQVPGAGYHVHAFQNDFYRAFADINSRSATPILCGGTGMYIHAILQQHELTAVPVNDMLRSELSAYTHKKLINRLKQYSSPYYADESSAKRLIRAIEIADYLQYNKIETIERPRINPLVIGLYVERSILRERIKERLEARFRDGMVAEIESLIASGIPTSVLIDFGMEYKFITQYLQGVLSEQKMKELLFIAICQFAKRQMTFFRKMEKDGVDIKWVDGNNEFDVIFKQVDLFYREKNLNIST